MNSPEQSSMEDVATQAPEAGLRERQKERNRGAILAAALEMFVDVGYFGTSVGEIAERAELSTGTYYNYFDDKESALRALLEDSFEDLIARIDEAQSSASTLAELLHDTMHVACTHIAENAAIYSVVHRNMALVRELIDLSRLQAPVERFVAMLPEEEGRNLDGINREYLTEAITGLVLEVGQAMLYRDPVDTENAANFLAGMTYGGLVRMRDDGADPDAGRRVADEAQIEFPSTPPAVPTGDGLRERRKAENRDAILVAARDAFAELGYQATGVRDIGRRAELSSGTLYNYFADKEEIFRALANRYFGIFANQAAFCREHSESLEELIASQFRIAYESTMSEPVMFEMISRNMSEVWRMMSLIENLIRNVSELAIDTRGLIDQGLMPDLDADYLVVSILGVGFSLGRVVARGDATDCDAGVQFGTDLFTGGILHLGGLDPSAATPPFKKRYRRKPA